MTKLKNLAENFLQKSQNVNSPTRSQPINPFHSLFQIQDLNEKDSSILDQILLEAQDENLGQQDSFEKDLFQLKRITKELKAIQRQEIVLIGERIHEARKIFETSQYKEETFKKWLEFTFGSYKTGYNYLAFYKLYLALPDGTRNSFKDMPAKAAYVLASKDGPIDQKVAIIEDSSLETAEDIILAIQKTFGTDSKARLKKSTVDKSLNTALKSVEVIAKKRSILNSDQKKRAQLLVALLRKIIQRS